MTYMIMPAKHISISESLFGLGAYLLSILGEPKSLEEVWKSYSKVNNTKEYPAYHGFDNVVLALDYLYCIGAVGYDSSGKIFNANTSLTIE